MTARGGGGSRQGLRGRDLTTLTGLSGGGANGGGIFRRESEPSYQAAHSASSFRQTHLPRRRDLFIHYAFFKTLPPPRQTVSGSRRHLYTDLFCRGGRSFSCQEATNTISHLQEIYKYISSKHFFFFSL